MKIMFFNKAIFEGTAEECEAFKNNFLDTLVKLDDELKDTYPMKATDTYESYFEALKFLNPFVYDTLYYIKEGVGDYFLEYRFKRMGLAGISVRVYADLETKKPKVYTLGFIFNIISLGLDMPHVWRFSSEEGDI